MTRLHTFILASALLLLGAGHFAQPADASEAPLVDDFVTVDLISEVPAMMPGQPFEVGILYTLEPHWHVYWSNPGDSGLAPDVIWTLPEGFTASESRFPYPESIPVEPLVSFGYEHQVLFTTTITPPTDLPIGDAITLQADVSWLVCKEECIPGDGVLMLTLPVEAEAATPGEDYAALFNDTRANLPLEGSGWIVTSGADDENLMLTLTPPDYFEGTLTEVEFFPYESDLINYSAAQKLTATETGYLLTMARSDWSTGTISSVAGVLVSKDGWRGAGSEHAIAFDTAEPREATPSTVAAVGTTTPTTGSTTGGNMSGVSSLWMALLFAFIGGLILNLMPCVLPVLSLKVFGFIKHADEGKAKAIKHAGVFTAGVVLSFMVLAVVLIGLRAGGQELGLGFHLQSPAFLIVLSAFLFLLGLSMLGVFEVGASLTGVGNATGHFTGYPSTFMNGVTATIVATPCTAPFMGPALGFALTQPPVAIMAIFMTIGLGMSSPYFALAASPGLMKFVPKPGAWMETFKEAMGFLLFATVIYLGWVLGNQTGSDGVIALLITLLFLGFAGWMLNRFAPITAPLANQRNTQLAALVLGVLGLWIGLNGVQGSTPATAEGPGTAIAAEMQGSIAWEPYSAERLAALQAAGEPVFIDFTADWCISCKAIEQVVFSREDVQRRLNELGVTTLRADWTNRDAEITRALARFGRNSVPAFVLIDGNAEPLVLPEVLTPGILLQALNGLES